MQRYNSDPDGGGETAVTGDLVQGHKVGGDMDKFLSTGRNFRLAILPSILSVIEGGTA